MLAPLASSSAPRVDRFFLRKLGQWLKWSRETRVGSSTRESSQQRGERWVRHQWSDCVYPSGAISSQYLRFAPDHREDVYYPVDASGAVTSGPSLGQTVHPATVATNQSAPRDEPCLNV